MNRLFIHIPKNAGMSIRRHLADRVAVASPRFHKSVQYTRAVRNHMAKRGEHQGYEHARWRDLNGYAHKLKAFAIVRNPWSRVVSRYFYGQMVANNGRDEKHADLIVYPKLSFEEFLEERTRWGHEPFYWHRAVRGWYPQKDYVVDECGTVRCAILRCEHLAEDLKSYMDVDLPDERRNVTPDTKPYEQMYTKETRRIVAEWYAADIEHWGFDFDTPATKNTWATAE